MTDDPRTRGCSQGCYKLLIYGVSAKSLQQKSLLVWEHPQNPCLTILIIMQFICVNPPFASTNHISKTKKFLIQTQSQKFQILQCCMCVTCISKVAKNDLKISYTREINAVQTLKSARARTKIDL